MARTRPTRSLCLLAGVIALPFMAPPLSAQDVAPKGDSYSLMEEGAKLLFRGLMTEIEPTLRDMGSALDEIRPELESMGPKLRQLVALMGDVKHYEAPERLPNGDILIRRSAGAPPPPPLPEGIAPKDAPLGAPLGAPLAPLAPKPPQPGPNGQIDL